MTQNKIIFSISYITNFKPHVITDFNRIKLFKSKKNNKIICRNFFLFLLLLKYLKKKNLFKSTLFIKPFKKKMYTILRAPYRHKLARHQFSIDRFKIVSKLQFPINNNIDIKNNSDLYNVLTSLKKFYVWFETNIVYQHQVKLFFNFYYKNNFLINNYK